MPVTRNGYYNDPALAEMFGNVSKAFAPPDAKEVLAYGQAGLAQQKYGQLAKAFSMAQDPNANLEMLDRTSAVAGAYNPNQGFVARDMADKRSGVNNAADNTRALQQTGMQQRGETDRAMLTPVSEGATRFVPPSIADRYGVDQTQSGAIKVNQGDQAYLPGGRVITGPEKPMTEDQLKARILGTLPVNEQRAMALGSTPVENVVGPDGKPQVAWRADAVGQKLAPKASDMTDVGRLQAERDALPANDPNRAAYDARIAALGRGQQQSKYDQISDEKLAVMNDKINETALTSYSNKGTLDRLSQLANSPDMDSGKYAELRLEAKKALNALGVDTGNVSDEEALRALASQFALKLRDPSQGAGMPGSLSDSDRNFLAGMAPGLETTTEGQKKLISYYSTINNRNIDIDKLRQQYVKAHGRLDEGFRAAVTDFAQANPLFGEQTAGITGIPGSANAPAQGAAPPVAQHDPQAIADELRKRGVIK